MSHGVTVIKRHKSFCFDADYWSIICIVSVLRLNHANFRPICRHYVRKHIHIVYFVGVVGVFWVLLNFWRSGEKVSGDEMCPVQVPTNPQNPIVNKLPMVKINGGERGFFFFFLFLFLRLIS